MPTYKKTDLCFKRIKQYKQYIYIYTYLYKIYYSIIQTEKFKK